MSKNHLLALEEALASKDWRAVAVLPGNDYRISATWQIERGSGQSRLFIDFDGLERGGDYGLPLEKSYGCQVRGREAIALYFRRVNRSQTLWKQELADFVLALDNEAETKSETATDRPGDGR
jgi:hypothetical protein